MRKIIFCSLVTLIFAVHPLTTVAQINCTDRLAVVTLSSQADVDAFDCTDFAGHLTISGNNISSLAALSSLRTVGSLDIFNNANLVNLHGLESLEVITGSSPRGGILTITANAKLNDINGLSSLRAINAPLFETISITNNPVLRNIDGLVSIKTLICGLTIADNARLENLDGLKNLTSIQAEDISSFNVAVFTIENNAALKNVNGLSSLTTIRAGRNGGLYIKNNPLLTNIDGFSSLTSIDATTTALVIDNNTNLKNINGLKSLARISWGPAGLISINNNNKLENVDGLSSIKSLGIISSLTMTVTNNPMLARCCGLFPILRLVSLEPNMPLVVIGGNGSGCTMDEILMGGDCDGNNGTGLRAEYFNNTGLSGAPVLIRVDQQVNFIWNAASPGSVIRADNFSARWTGKVEAPVTGSYVFSTVSDDGVRLWINGKQVINNWTDHAPVVNNSVAIPLVAGTKYDVRMEFYEHTLGAVARLLWTYPGQAQQPVPQSRLYPAGGGAGGNGTGLYGEYFNNRDLSGSVDTRTVVPQVDFTWNASSPFGGISADNFSVRWTGQVEAPVTGNYVFSTVSDDGVRLWINGVQVINNWTDHAPTTNSSAAIPLTAGTRYDIKMEYYEHTLGAVARLLWSYPGQAQQPIPQARLYPASRPGEGTGLRADYFNSIDLSSAPALTRLDPHLNFTWNAASPAAGVNADNFSVRWTGQVEAPVTGNYVFTMISDDGVRLWLNGVLLIDNWTDHAPTVNNSVPVVLGREMSYNVHIEYYEHTLGAVARLLWSYPGQAQQPIPQSRLYPGFFVPTAQIESESTGASPDQEDLQIHVYPNPVDNIVNITVYSDVNEEAEISIQSSFSRERVEVSATLLEGVNHFEIPVHNLRNGLYVLTINRMGHMIKRKIIISR